MEETKDPSGSPYPILDWYALPAAAEVTLPRKKIVLEAFSGLESELARVDLDLRESVPENVVVPMKFFSQVSRDRWFGGNTHLHLKDLDAESTQRYLTEIPYVDRLDLLFISHLRGIHLTGPIRACSSPGAVRWRAIQARRVPARLGRRGRHRPGPLGGDKVLVAHRLVGSGEFEHPVEDHPAAPGASAVEAEHELIQVAAQVGGLHRSLVGAQQPPLGQ